MTRRVTSSPMLDMAAWTREMNPATTSWGLVWACCRARARASLKPADS